MTAKTHKLEHKLNPPADTAMSASTRATSLLGQSRRSAHESSSGRRKEGKAMRQQVPFASHAEFVPAGDRPDPIALLQGQDDVRITSLVPIRFGRMAASPYSFYRGAAIVMADDLSKTPTSGWLAQACGDAHLDNFGAFGTEQGTLVFDVNDFDETYPAPWEWDVKRLVASAVLAGRETGASAAEARGAARAAAAGYRDAMHLLADMGVMSRWNSVVPAATLMLGAGVSKRQIDRVAAEALVRTSAGSFPKLTTLVGSKRTLKEKPPLVVRITDQKELYEVRKGFEEYKTGLRPELRLLLDRYELIDFARKVVGVGSVGMRAYVGLFLSADGDPLFLQVKMAVASVLERHVPTSNAFSDAGERVVVGQRLMQAAGDPLLGWVSGQAGRHFYVRQLRDMKVSADLTTMTHKKLTRYAEACGQVLAHAHARTGDPALITGYLGTSARFDEALTDFAVAYADQTERDHASLAAAISDGRVVAQTGI
jgi:uncharacterized protein (DUF2252 family)